MQAAVASTSKAAHQEADISAAAAEEAGPSAAAPEVVATPSPAAVAEQPSTSQDVAEIEPEKSDQGKLISK